MMLVTVHVVTCCSGTLESCFARFLLSHSLLADFFEVLEQRIVLGIMLLAFIRSICSVRSIKLSLCTETFLRMIVERHALF